MFRGGKEVKSGVSNLCSTLKFADSGIQIDVNGLKFNMIKVKGGTFIMGDNNLADPLHDASPEHAVTVSDYYIAETEVTNELWALVNGGSILSGISGYREAVKMKVWDDIIVFIDKLNKLTGLNFRLPYEAEWEYAALGGSKSKGYKYSGGDEIALVALYNNTSGDVASKYPNELGIYDMSGSAWEHCIDFYGKYSSDAQINPKGPDTGEYHVLRGGYYGSNASECLVKYRRTDSTVGSKNGFGLRLVLDIQQ